VLWTWGPAAGPAVLYWAQLIVLLATAWLLSRYAPTPLRFQHWLLLGLGFSAFAWSAYAVVVAWLILLGLRARAAVDSWRAGLFDLMQVALALLTAIALAVLVGSAVPLNVAGFGPREGVTASVFAVAGLGSATGLTVSVTFGVLSAVATAPGVLVVLRDAVVGSPPSSRAIWSGEPREMVTRGARVGALTPACDASQRTISRASTDHMARLDELGDPLQESRHG